MSKPKREKPPKPVEPEWEWGETPAGAPELLWGHESRPLWAQVLPEQGAVLLMEKERLLLRRVDSGEMVWEQPSRGLPEAVAHDARGIVLGLDRDVWELDPSTGAERWRTRLGASISTLELDERAVYASSQGPLFALERKAGKQRWRIPSAWEPELRAYPHAGILVVDNPETETIHAYHAESGQQKWEFSAEGQPLALGPLSAGLIPVSAHESGMVALDPRTGQVRWRVETDGAFEQPAVPIGEHLLVTDGRVHLIEAASGKEIWKRTLVPEADSEDRFFSARAASDGSAVFADTWRGRFLCLEPDDGKCRWERRPGQVHGLASDGKRVYLRVCAPEPANQWSVVALELQTGDLAWELKSRRMVPDVTPAEGVLIVELKPEVLALRVN